MMRVAMMTEMGYFFTYYLPVGSLQRNDRNDSADYSSMKKSI